METNLEYILGGFAIGVTLWAVASAFVRSRSGQSLTSKMVPEAILNKLHSNKTFKVIIFEQSKSGNREINTTYEVLRFMTLPSLASKIREATEARRCLQICRETYEPQEKE